MPIVNGLAAEFDGKMKFEVIAIDAPGAAERIAKYGFDKHGMVITDQDDKVVWSEDGHTQKAPVVKAAIVAALGG